MYKVIETETGKVVEEHSRPESAYRAMLIYNAQEAQYGRPQQYRCEPAIEPAPHPRDLNLPNWARKALGV
jgi:hypothetical protein